MDWSILGQRLLMALYTFALVMVAIYGLHRWVIVWLYYRHRKKAPKPAGTFEELPPVTVQLPMYNERPVARRIILQTCKIDYPKDKLQIQVLDDSTDGTPDVCRAAVAEARAMGFDIEYIHRENRQGYKAGALENGLKTAKGEFVTIFDADFIPEPQILRKSIQYFTDPKVCVVQTRWEHLNREANLLTRSQAIFLDGHFAIEHVARNRSDRFMSFNGTAGTWRKAAIADAGGWQHDTLTEDLDLSYRAQLRGWKFIFLPDLTAPAELPPEMHAFKAQQFRWTKGGAQTALKLLPKILLSKAPLKVKIEAFFHLTGFTLHLYMTILVLLLFPAIYFNAVPLDIGTWSRGLFDMTVFGLATLSASAFYLASQWVLFGDWRTALKYLPVLMAIGVGLCVSNTKAILEALFGKKSEFVRTPKYGTEEAPAPLPRKKRKFDIVPYLEMAMGLYMSAAAVASLYKLRAALTTPFLVMFAFGFFYVSGVTFLSQRQKQAATEPDQADQTIVPEEVEL